MDRGNLDEWPESLAHLKVREMPKKYKPTNNERSNREVLAPIGAGE